MSNSFLSQEEIDSLLNGSDDSPSNAWANDNSVNLLSDIEKDLLGEVGNISMGSASTALYQIINQKVNITTPVVSITTLKEIKETFETPTVVLDVEYTSGIIGRNILIIKTEDAAVIANLMMGGDGVVKNHELSEIEISAVQEAMNQMIGSAATSMATMFSREVNISPPISKIWNNNEEPLSSEIPEEEAIVRVSFRMTIGNLVDSNIMQILPVETAKKIVSIMIGKEDENSDASKQNYSTVNNEISVESYNKSYEEVYEVNQPVSEKTIIETPQPQVEVHKASFEPLVESKSSGVSNKNIDLILDVPLDISVVLGRTKKSIKDILNFSTGSLIELDKLAEEPVEVLVNGKTIALGEVVVVDENFGVRITSIVSNTERINSLKK
ncbi:flagellar motor switch phosphatase FliY [Clostridium sp.]|uniref:flagellar motor switch phosphatase FliY n=1 Tax=Clostridium sp. TaxID=1506 RepID=UPI001DCDBC47|nr:flagellar motor switch phosphatase FliY [Clostridium sp.]MBS5986352.1 flagellar motor switch phosphatase FliY [Clostridium sp.]